MNPLSLTITIIFITVVLYVTTVGFWPFTKAFGLSGLLSFWKAGEQLKKKIKEAIQQLPTASTTEEQRNEFARQYNEINDYFKKGQSVFSHLWQEFTEQLVKPTDKEPGFQNSIRPEKFFILEDFLKQKNINLKLLESMPGILLGLGVLGTFVGLSISLIQAFPLLQDNPETEKLTDAVQILISGAGVAFFTSVFGLLCSLIFNIISDKKISALEIKLKEFNSLLEKSLKFITEEDLLMEHLKESEQQGKHLSNMDEKIALKIGDIIRNSVEQMGEKVQQVISQGNQNISEKFLDDMANQMTKGMGDFSRKQLENMEKTLASLQNNIPPLISRLESSQKQNEETAKTLIDQLAESGKNSQDQINKSLIDTMQDMKGAFEEITQNLKEGMTQTLSNSSKELENLLSNVSEKNHVLLKQTEESQVSFQKNIGETTDKLYVFADRLDKIISELSDTAAPKIQSAVETFNEAAEQQKQIVEKNKLYIYSLDNLSKELKEMSFSMSKTMENLPDFITQINQSNESLHEIWSDYEKRFYNVDESAEKLFKNVSEGLNLVSQKSAKHIDDLYNLSKNISNNFAQAATLEELKEAVSELSEAVNKLKE